MNHIAGYAWILEHWAAVHMEWQLWNEDILINKYSK